ncbi:MAG: penicillin-binding transpeptidase domain-containing protein, partial [Bacteroidota bacterium]
IDSLDRNPDHYDLSLALGGGQMSLLELTSAYSAFADGGIYPGTRAILDIHDLEGGLAYTEQGPRAVQVLDPRVAWLISDILSDDAARRIGFGRNSTLKLDRTAAVKTGTTTNYHDNWTVGYTQHIVAGVWVGNSNYEAMHNVTGLTGAAPIWHNFMRTVLAGTPDEPFPRPEGLVPVEVCTLSGLLPTPECPNTRREWFIAGTEPTRTDSLYKQVWLDALTGRPADGSTPASRRQLTLVLDLPASAVPWARSQGIQTLADLGQPASQGSQPGLVLLSPAPDTVYRLAKNFSPTAQQILISAATNADFASVSLLLDGEILTSFTAPPYEFWWAPVAGDHTLEVQGMTADGRLLRGEPAHFIVLPPE